MKYSFIIHIASKVSRVCKCTHCSNKFLWCLQYILVCLNRYQYSSEKFILHDWRHRCGNLLLDLEKRQKKSTVYFVHVFCLSMHLSLKLLIAIRWHRQHSFVCKNLFSHGYIRANWQECTELFNLLFYSRLFSAPREKVLYSHLLIISIFWSKIYC